MKQAPQLAFLEGIALPSFGPKISFPIADVRPILVDTADIAAAAAVAAARQKRGGK